MYVLYVYTFQSSAQGKAYQVGVVLVEPVITLIILAITSEMDSEGTTLQGHRDNTV